MKICKVCGIPKELNQFCDSANGSQGKQFCCKECRRKYQKNYQRKVRQEAINAYGGRCSCCGETEVYFLAIDHIFGGGNRIQRERGEAHRGGYNFYLQLKKLGYPQREYRVLCHNCNMGREVNGGVCPHQKQPEFFFPLVWKRTRK